LIKILRLVLCSFLRERSSTLGPPFSISGVDIRNKT
jgi:hypothetical protein